MTIIDNETENRGYDLPDGENDLSADVLRLISALVAIDIDIQTLYAGLAQKAAADHGHEIADVEGLQAALDAKAGAGSTIAMALVTGLVEALAAKAALDGPTFTGTVSGPTPALSDSSTRLATTAWVKTLGYLTGVPNDSVGSAQLKALAVVAGKLAAGAVDATDRLANKIVTPAKMNDAAGVSILGRSANSVGARADIEAAANGLVLSRLSNVLGFNTITALFDAVFGTTADRIIKRGASGWAAAALPPAMTWLGTITTTSGSAQSLTDIEAGYTDLLLIFNGVSTGGNNLINLATSVDGSTFGADVSLTPTGGAGNGVFGSISIHRMNEALPWRIVDGQLAIMSSGSTETSAAVVATSIVGQAPSADGVPTAIRISTNGTFDAGAVRVYGIT